MTHPTRYRVFLVEDEMTIALMIEGMLEDLGFEVAGMVMRLEPALELAQTITADVAILDINLDGKQSFPIADILRERGIPFFFATGYGSKGLNDNYEGTFTLKKPFLSSELEKAVERAVG
ncbi:response regulator [Lichenihabitans psoromatis]|uniref:response regulator n=1 Tax=Lichenihabitans psoromatis TaxID=2528642 RepID=UPI0010383F9D|nr:response regulator [Lichenihabitans psoromatis]